MYAHQINALADELRKPSYDGYSSSRAYWQFTGDGRYDALQQTLFLSRKQLRALILQGPIGRPSIQVPDEDAAQFPGEIPGLPKELAWEDFLVAWTIARGP